MCIVALLGGTLTAAPARPFEGGQYKGRIAYSADGDHNDPDDWAASPVALAIFAGTHFDEPFAKPAGRYDIEMHHAPQILAAPSLRTTKRCATTRAAASEKRTVDAHRNGVADKLTTGREWITAAVGPPCRAPCVLRVEKPGSRGPHLL